MVFKAISVNVKGGALGRGSAVREYVEVGPISSSLESQISCLVNCGWCPLRSSASDIFARKIGFAVGSLMGFAL